MGTVLIDPNDPNRWLWDGESLPRLHFGPCTLHVPSHEWDYIRKAAGGKQKVSCPFGRESETCSQFDALV